MIVYVQLTLTKKPMGKVVVKLFENFRWTTWCDMVWHGQLPKSGTHSRFQPLDAASLKIEAWKSKERNLLIWKVKTCPKYIQIHPHPPIPPLNPSPSPGQSNYKVPVMIRSEKKRFAAAWNFFRAGWQSCLRRLREPLEIIEIFWRRRLGFTPTNATYLLKNLKIIIRSRNNQWIQWIINGFRWN